MSNDELRGSRSWWIATAIDLGSTWTVPVFVMISGALVLAPRAHAAGPWAFYRKRFIRIIPALIVWHLVYLIVVRMMLNGEHPSLKTVVKLLIDGKIYTALYFLWLIAGLYAVAPVLAAFLATGGERRAKIMAAVALGWTMAAFIISGISGYLGMPRPIYLGAWTQWWPYVGYFLAGWALHRVRLSARGIAVTAVIAVALLAEGVWQWGNAADHRLLQALIPTTYLGSTIAIASIGLFLIALSLGARWVPSPRTGRLLVRLSNASFGVFLVHLLILALIQWALPSIPIGESLPATVATFVVVLVASFAVSLGAAKVPYLRAIF